ncbi:hypothetical protein G5T42_13685 [Microbacterium sp. 4R-513]|uniref:hypothetical protein n=1 Tax=Microbacterium sp. 4R-513 TaxID=2567934 RepID=UPI0013E1B4E7|nr:hypothetical protein [Microbacterium sp. 4R-513]QIG40396.1 hypothetical protein G5T42_13685 [Microbacterium sp. 4R-513]
MNSTRNNRKVLAATLLVALVGSLAACNTAERTETVNPVAHGAGELAAYLQIEEQIRLARTSTHRVSATQVILDDIATERERLRPSSATQTIQEDIAKERDRLAEERSAA